MHPMLPDETCWFLAADFDKKSRMTDVAAFRDAARARGVPIAIERSRSGNNAHARIFFSEPISVAEARRLGALLITVTMARCPDIGFDYMTGSFRARIRADLGISPRSRFRTGLVMLAKMAVKRKSRISEL